MDITEALQYANDNIETETQQDPMGRAMITIMLAMYAELVSLRERQDRLVAQIEGMKG